MAINICAGMTRACEELPRVRATEQLSVKLSTVDQTVQLTSDTVQVTIVIGMLYMPLSTPHTCTQRKQNYCVCTYKAHVLYVNCHTFLHIYAVYVRISRNSCFCRPRSL